MKKQDVKIGHSLRPSIKMFVDPRESLQQQVVSTISDSILASLQASRLNDTNLAPTDISSLSSPTVNSSDIAAYADDLELKSSDDGGGWSSAVNGSFAAQKRINGLQPHEVLSSLAYQTQDFPLRVDITIHIRDLIPIAVISGMVVIFLCSMPFLLYQLRKHL